MGLKAKRTDIEIALADPLGAALYSYYTTGELKSEGSSITEGIGQGRITDNLEGVAVDRAYRSPTPKPWPICSSCCTRKACAWAAPAASTSPAPIRLASELGPGHTIVTMLCDYGTRYQSRLFNPGIPALQGPAGAGMAGGPRTSFADRVCLSVLA